VILLDKSYSAEIIAADQSASEELQLSERQFYENVSNQELSRAIEREENFKPESIFQIKETYFITDSQHGKLSRFSPQEGLRTIAVFGGKLKNLHSVSVDKHGEIYVWIQTKSQPQDSYLVKLTD
jgi:hypothetical protein